MRRNREAILEAGLRVFTTAGFDAANVRDIVRESGLSQGSFYNYFPTKEALFEALTADIVDAIRSASRQARTEAKTPWDFVHGSYRAYIEVLGRYPHAGSLISRNIVRFRELFYGSAQAQGIAFELAEDLERGIESGMLKEVDVHGMATAMIAAGVEVVFQGLKRSEAPDTLAAFLAGLFAPALSP